MFDFAWSELGIIALVSVLVLGPKQLPETMRTMAKVMRRVRSLGSEFQGHVNEMIREAELEELRQKVQQFSQTSVTAEVAKVVDPTGELAGELQGPVVESTPDPHAIAAPAEPAVAPAAIEGAPPPAPSAPVPEASPSQAPTNDPAIQSKTAAP